MARPRTTDIGTRRKALLEVARAVLSEKGYRDVRLEDVAKRAKVAKGTLYLYFKNKENICSAVMQEVVNRLEERVRLIPPQKTALEKISLIAAAEISFIDENRDFLSHFSPQRSPMIGPAGAKALKECFKGHVDQLAELLRACVKEGSLREHDVRRGALFFISLARMFALHELPAHPGKPMAAHARDLMDLLLNGLSVR